MAIPEPVVIIGAGGFARETAAAIAAVNEQHPRWNLLGHLDDDPCLEGCTVGSRTVLGPSALAADMADTRVVVCTGSPSNYASRRCIVERLHLGPDRWATVVHPAAVLGAGTSLGAGSVVLAGVVTTTDVEIGSHVAIMPGSIFTHDDRVGDYATFGAGVRLAGGVCVGTGAYVGSGALVRENRSVGEWSLVGMGAVVTHDIPAREVWAGVPARRRRAARPDGPSERSDR